MHSILSIVLPTIHCPYGVSFRKLVLKLGIFPSFQYCLGFFAISPLHKITVIRYDIFFIFFKIQFLERICSLVMKGSPFWFKADFYHVLESIFQLINHTRKIEHDYNQTLDWFALIPGIDKSKLRLDVRRTRLFDMKLNFVKPWDHNHQ